jgi:hypothetical protein
MAVCSLALPLEFERALVVRPALLDVLVCSRIRNFSLGVQRAHLRLRGEIGATQWQNFANPEIRKILQGK